MSEKQPAELDTRLDDKPEAKSDSKFDSASFVKNLPGKPGVYRMLNSDAEVIYVGKAVNLKNRVGSYFQKNLPHPKTRVMVSQITNIEVTVTHTENEALLLENNLIKSLKPRYNVLYRDDKSYPYIFVATEHDFPRLALHRGAQRTKGRYFGPYPSAGAVRDTLSLLQKLFPVRQCEDNFYNNRSRPCLQYQIKRCTAPCVGLVDKARYAEDVRHAVMFLQGKNNEVVDDLIRRMEKRSAAQDYEQAAIYRDQIVSLRKVQEKQYISADGGDLDVIAASADKGLGCIQVFTIRGGRNLGSKVFFPRQNHLEADVETTDELITALLSAFIPQYYLSGGTAANTADTGNPQTSTQSREVPAEILLSHALPDTALLQQVLSDESNHKVILSHKLRGQRARWVKMAQQNAQTSLKLRLNSQATMLQRYDALQDAVELSEMPTRLECFDISHTMGEATVASCVVFDINGPLKSDYRRFNIEGITPGDDYAAMHQALTRRYKRLKEGEAKLPDILFIDGGKGQISQAEAVLEELQVENVMIIGIAKGPGRKPGLESLYLSGQRREIILPGDSKALHLIQQIRDEAHRFAITGHRQRRQRARNRSPLEEIPGLGAKRRQILLKQFGGLQEVARAGVEDLNRVNGISRKLAQLIYDAFHSEAS